MAGAIFGYPGDEVDMAFARGLAAFALLGLIFTLDGCGGNDDPAPIPDRSLELQIVPISGTLLGTSSTSRSLITVIQQLFPGDVAWIIYSSSGNSGSVAGFIQAPESSIGGSLTSSNAKDFNFESNHLDNDTISASYAPHGAFSGLIMNTSTNQNVTFTTNFSAVSDVRLFVPDIVGSYAGSASFFGLTETASMTIAASGGITGTTARGCHFTGTVAPSGENYFTVSLSFVSTGCQGGLGALSGIGYYDANAHKLYTPAVDSQRTTGFIFVGVKP
jgi:hypothetical protein